jgi:hypothetical protein
MKLVLKLTSALAALALASTALACGDHATKTAEATPAKPAVAKVEKKATTKAQKTEAPRPDANAAVRQN